MTSVYENRLTSKVIKSLAVSSLVAGFLLASGSLASQASAAEISSVGQPSLFNRLINKSAAHTKRIKKVAFGIGTSAMYSHANLLPKTDRFVQPAVAGNAIIGDGGLVCSMSGLGHRSTCGSRL